MWQNIHISDSPLCVSKVVRVREKETLTKEGDKQIQVDRLQTWLQFGKWTQMSPSIIEGMSTLWLLSNSLSRQLLGNLHLISNEQYFTWVWKGRSRACVICWYQAWEPEMLSYLECGCDGGCAVAQPSYGVRLGVTRWALVVVATAIHWANGPGPGRQVGLSRTFHVSWHLQGSGQTDFRFDSLHPGFCWDVQTSSQVLLWSVNKCTSPISFTFNPKDYFDLQLILSTDALSLLRIWAGMMSLLFPQGALDLWEVIHMHIKILA